MARILFVDDEPDIRTLVKLRLERAGHEVINAASAPDALDLIRRQGPPDLVVIDVMMPEVSGFDLLWELRNRPETANLPAIFLSAVVDQASIRTGTELGATYLTKPFVASALLKAIDRALKPSEGSD
ncbi:MAG TPA: response regulator [Candidatus Eisenbacteria bacterium]|jgi:CheY-like chemotaxis protein